MEKLILNPVSRAHRRNRQSRTILVTKTKIYTFNGQSIDGVCVSELVDANKNGKWSTKDYAVILAEGVSVIHLKEDWETCEYINDVSSVKSMAKALNLENSAPSIVAEYIKSELPDAWERHLSFKKRVAALDDAGISETLEIEYNYEFRNNRCGHLHLLLDEKVWDFKEIPGKLVIKEENHYSGRGGGGCHYKLIIDASIKVEELYESDYGDDALDTRGWKKEYNGGWVKEVVAVNSNSPFANLAHMLNKK